MFNFLSPSNIFIILEKVLKFINSVFFAILLVGLSFALFLSPPDYLQGDAVRIMYVHVPSAWIGLASYTTIVVLSILGFVLVWTPFDRTSSGVKIKEFKVLIFSSLKILITSFKIAASPILDALIILGI